MNDIQVYASPLPFSNKQVKGGAAPGSSIQDIILNVCPPQFWPAGVTATAQINGHIIPQKHWHAVRPKLGTIVNIKIVPQGGKGKKNPLASLLSIAIMIAAPYAAGAILGTTLAATQVGIGALTYGGLLSGAIGIVGRMLVSALAPPPKPSKMGNGSISNPAESPTQFIEGAKNSLNPYGVVPICLGTNRMFPLQAARPYTETVDDDQYVRQLFTYGWGPKMVIADMRIGETSLSEFSNFEFVHKLEGNLHEPTEIYPNDPYQDDFSVLIRQVDGFTVRSTQDNVNELSVDFTFTRGLAQFDTQGKRNARRVQLELQYAPTGTDDWSPAVSTYKDFSGASLNVPPAILLNPFQFNSSSGGERTDTVVIDKYSGVIRLIQGQIGFQAAQPIPENAIRLATTKMVTTKSQTGVVTNVLTVTDARNVLLFGNTIETSSDFAPSQTGTTVNISSGALIVNDLDILGNQTEALRKTARVVFPVAGKYDYRVRRISPDTDSDQIFDQVYLTSARSIKYTAPVTLQGINGTAMRIKATDQLNGALDQLNVLASLVVPDYDINTGTWEDAITSNPASLYRYVLQGEANAKPLPDSKINIPDFESWHTHCVNQGYTYNRVIDYDTSVDEMLRDIAASGAASPAIVDGKRTIVIDREKDDIVQVITPRNSWGYSGEMVYPDLPHAFRVQFRNADAGYAQDERIVYDDGYDESNAEKFELLELQSCTDSNLAYKTARRHIATARLRPETHSVMMDFENLVAIRGDRVKFYHDAPIIGVGDGRIKEVFDDGDNVTGFSIDDTVTIPDNKTYYVRIRLADGTQIYKELVTSIGYMTEFDFAVPFDLMDTPAPGDLCAFVEAGGELDCVIQSIEPQGDLTARITMVNYAPEIFVAESTSIPPFETNITTPLEFLRPVPPELISDQSNESVMLVNADGSFLTRAIFTLDNLNDGDVQTLVKIRETGSSVFTNANVLEATPERLIITGLTSGTKYDIHIRYKRLNSSMQSLPLQLNGYTYIGTSGLPNDVTGFLINVAGSVAMWNWDANTDIDIAYYRMKFSGAYIGATWETAQLFKDKIYETQYSAPLQGGTYLIKAVDRDGNESANAAVIITYNPGLVANAVAVITEQPEWDGVMDNVLKLGDTIVMADPSLGIGYYYFSEYVNLTDVFVSYVTTTIAANGAFINNLFAIDDLFTSPDIFGSAQNDIFAMDDMFAVDDLYGIEVGSWDVQLQSRTTQDDPEGTPTWTEWAEHVAGNAEFYGIEFRIRLRSFAANVSPQVTVAEAVVDMPDRLEWGDDLIVPATGATIVYDPEFQANPAVGITIQDGDANDEIQFISKTAGGFSFKVYNTVLAAYVERTYDYIVSGYGRKN